MATTFSSAEMASTRCAEATGNDTLIGNRGNDVMLGEDRPTTCLIWNNGDGNGP